MQILFSVLIYGMVFLSSYLVVPADNTKRNYVPSFIMAVFIPSFIAGIRALTVGTDVRTYAITVFKFFGLGGHRVASIMKSTSPLFALVAYISGKFSSNIHLFLFFVELLIILPVYFFYFKTEYNRKLSILLYLLLFFNYSLNIMRQSISASSFFFALIMFREKKYLFSCLAAFVAFGFHTTALVYIVIVVAIMFYDKKIANKKVASLNLVVLFLAEIIIFSFILSFANILLRFGILDEVIYNRYMSIFLGKNIAFSRLMIFELVFRIVLIVFIIMCFMVANKEHYDRENNIIAYFAIFGLFTYCLAVFFLHTSVAYRFTQNFDYFVPLYLAKKVDNVQITAMNKNISKLFLVMLFGVHWLLAYIIMPAGMGFGTEFYRFGI